MTCVWSSLYLQEATLHVDSVCSTCHGHLVLLRAWLSPVTPPLHFPPLQDWWASTSFSSYYRKWNTLVHDWIYSYLYLDMRAAFTSPLPAIFATILVSALFHEYLLAIALGFASPVLMIEFAGLGGMPPTHHRPT